MSFFIEFDPTEGMQELDDSDFAAKIENQFTPGHLVQSSYSKLASCLAIFSIVFSAVLSLMHQHHRIDGEACCGVPHQHSQSQIPGLEDIPASDCDCTTQLANDAESLPANEQEESDHCSVCRMVFEHAIGGNELPQPTASGITFDAVFFVVQLSMLDVSVRYLNRGPPAIS